MRKSTRKNIRNTKVCDAPRVEFGAFSPPSDLCGVEGGHLHWPMGELGGGREDGGEGELVHQSVPTFHHRLPSFWTAGSVLSSLKSSFLNSKEQQGQIVYIHYQHHACYYHHTDVSVSDVPQDLGQRTTSLSRWVFCCFRDLVGTDGNGGVIVTITIHQSRADCLGKSYDGTLSKVEADLNVEESNDQLSIAYIHKVPTSMYMMTMQIDQCGEGEN